MGTAIIGCDTSAVEGASHLPSLLLLQQVFSTRQDAGTFRNEGQHGSALWHGGARVGMFVRTWHVCRQNTHCAWRYRGTRLLEMDFRSQRIRGCVCRESLFFLPRSG